MLHLFFLSSICDHLPPGFRPPALSNCPRSEGPRVPRDRGCQRGPYHGGSVYVGAACGRANLWGLSGWPVQPPPPRHASGWPGWPSPRARWDCRCKPAQHCLCSAREFGSIDFPSHRHAGAELDRPLPLFLLSSAPLLHQPPLLHLPFLRMLRAVYPTCTVRVWPSTPRPFKNYVKIWTVIFCLTRPNTTPT